MALPAKTAWSAVRARRVVLYLDLLTAVAGVVGGCMAACLALDVKVMLTPPCIFHR
jgi:hypothetical protein